jgi:proteasome lid subunit RPN8/RPN11
VIIAARVLDTIIDHARVTVPRECCGILLGRFEDDEIVQAVAAANLAASPNRYEIDPRDHIAARRIARQSDLTILGFYHSHPHSAPEPSETDLAEVTYRDAFYLIVGRTGESWEARLFLFLEPHAATAVDLQVY